jgi:hypothetical protein
MTEEEGAIWNSQAKDSDQWPIDLDQVCGRPAAVSFTGIVDHGGQ